MTIEEKRKKKREYMRGYREKNKEKINAQIRKNYINLSEEEKEIFRAKHRIVTKKYDDANREEINKKKKDKNWYYNKEKRVEIRARYYENYPAKSILRTVKSRAKNKNLSFDLDEEWYEKEWAKGCAMTGIQFNEHRSKKPFTAHIDKIIPEKGYLKENCQLVIACYNQAKSSWTNEDVLIMAKALIENM